MSGRPREPDESAFTDTLISREFRERIVLVGVTLPGGTPAATEAGLDELALLVDTAGADVAGRVVQRRTAPDPATFLGRGKAEELRRCAWRSTPTPSSSTTTCRRPSSATWRSSSGRTAIDRTAVILDIFAQNARTPEGRAQVELALLRYRLPRLRGRGHSLSQQAGGIGTRGPGETQLEVDRRRLLRRMSRLEADLRQLDRTRRVQRRGAPAGSPAHGVAGRVHQRRQVDAAQPAVRRPTCSSRTGSSPPSTRGPASSTCPAGRRCS